MHHTTPTMLERLNALNALRRRKGHGRPLTRDDLLDLQQAKDATGKAALNDWDADAVFIRVETLVDLYRSLTPAGREALANDELVGGWFEGCLHDDCDADGFFCSTPSHSDEVPTVADFAEDLDHCSEQGVLFLY